MAGRENEFPIDAGVEPRFDLVRQAAAFERVVWKFLRRKQCDRDGRRKHRILARARITHGIFLFYF